MDLGRGRGETKSNYFGSQVLEHLFSLKFLGACKDWVNSSMTIQQNQWGSISDRRSPSRVMGVRGKKAHCKEAFRSIVDVSSICSAELHYMSCDPSFSGVRGTLRISAFSLYQV